MRKIFHVENIKGFLPVFFFFFLVQVRKQKQMIPLQVRKCSKTGKQEVNFSGLREILTGQYSSWVSEQKFLHRLWNIE